MWEGLRALADAEQLRRDTALAAIQYAELVMRLMDPQEDRQALKQNLDAIIARFEELDREEKAQAVRHKVPTV